MTENEIELMAIEFFENLGYTHLHGQYLKDRNLREVLLKDKILKNLEKINPSLPYNAIEDAIKQVERIKSSELLSDNESFHKLLTEGVKVDIQKEGITRGEIVYLVDFDNISNNDFIVANQFTIIENHHNKRPDIILFVNGIPLVVIELKNAASENAAIKSAYEQIKTYQSTIPSFFTYNAFCIISDGIEARSKTNLVQSKKLVEMLENSIRKYHNKAISSVEVLDELIKLGKDIQSMDKESKDLGLDEFEYAFYSAIAFNEDAKELMGKDKLRELAIVLTDRVRQNTSIDWTIKESVRAKLRVTVKKLLKEYGYPPNIQGSTTDIISEQAEKIAAELVG